MLKNPRKITFLKFFYLLFFVVSATLTITSSPEILRSSPLYKVGQILGVWALTGLSLQPVLASRFKPLETGVGLDRIGRWHSFNGKLTMVFAFLHPIMIFAGPIASGFSILGLIASFTIPHYLGLAALTLVIFTVFFALYSGRIGVKYETWRFIHIAGYAIVILGFAHSLYIGSDILLRGPVYYWWFFMAILAVLAVTYRYVVRIRFLKDSVYEVENVIHESDKVNTVFFKPLSGKKKFNAPGQFAFIKFASGSLPKEEHPFTISSSPTEEFHSHSIKESGDFTSLISKLEPGDRARIEGPYGVFSNVGMKGPFVFIAGGIGITPIRSMLKYMNDSGKTENSVLIYACRTTKDIAFKSELDQLSENGWLGVCYILSDEETEGYYHGYVSKEIIESETNDVSLKEAKFFICGPPAMMKMAEGYLIELGAGKNRIFTEEFSLK